jgi:hypothetical protein
MRLVCLSGGLGGRAWATNGCLVVGEDILETNVRVGHAQMRVLGIEDLDEFGGSVAHCSLILFRFPFFSLFSI